MVKLNECGHGFPCSCLRCGQCADDGHVPTGCGPWFPGTSARSNWPDDDGHCASGHWPGSVFSSHDARSPGGGGAADGSGAANGDATGANGSPRHVAAGSALGSTGPASDSNWRRACRYGAVQAMRSDVYAASRCASAHGSVHDVPKLPRRSGVRRVGVVCRPVSLSASTRPHGYLEAMS